MSIRGMVLLAVWGLAGCTAVATPTPAPPATAVPSPSASVAPTSGLATHTLGRVTFTTPSDWQVVIPRGWVMPTGPRLFLSNAPIADPCPSAFLGWPTCQKPLAQLPPDGILVTLSGGAIVLPNSYTPAPVTSAPSDLCRSTGGELEIHGLRIGPGSLFASACLRGPDFAANHQAFLAFVASFHT